MSKVLFGTLAAAVLAGCNNGNPAGSGTPASTASVVPALTWAAGGADTTVIRVQKYRNALFRDTATGKQLEPTLAIDKTPSQVSIEGGDFDELTYSTGRLQYAFCAHDGDAQPYVVERAMGVSDFEAFDKAFYDDKFFNLGPTAWDAQARLPFFVVDYQKGTQRYETTFTPSLSRLAKVSTLVDAYFKQMDGDGKPDKGVTETQYAIAAVNGTVTVTVSHVVQDDAGDVDETPVVLSGAKYSVDGKSSQAALLVTGGKGDSFTFPQPTGTASNPYVRLQLSISPKTDATFDTVLPVRVKT